MKQAAFLLACTLAFASACAGAHQHAEGHDAAHGHGGAAEREQTDWGIAARPHAPHRTVRIDMDDHMRFTPATIQVHEGETIDFQVRNNGRMLHEMVIGTQKELAEHAALMRKFPGMEHHDAWMTHVAPGHTGQLAWTFNRRGTFLFACLVPGHYEAGMRGEIRVVARPAHQH
jgi:uncharacterized cupredoxin-like copper-binding protein